MSQIKTRHADYQRIKGNLGFGKKLSITAIRIVAIILAKNIEDYRKANQEYLSTTENDALRAATVNVDCARKYLNLVK